MKIHHPSAEQQKFAFTHSLDETLEIPQTGSSAFTRTVYGKALAELTCQILGLTEIPINGNYTVNLDAIDQTGNFYEIKSVKNNSDAVIYDCRLKKEQACGKPIFYVFARHRINKATSLKNLWNQLSDKGLTLSIFPLHQIIEACEPLPINHIKTNRTKSGDRNGYQRSGYKDGYYRIKVQSLCNRPALVTSFSHTHRDRTFTGIVQNYSEIK